jgi:tryptophanyl-tRNA synthetase
MSARDQAVLAAVTNHSAKIGLMLFEMRRTADVVGELLEVIPEASDDEPHVLLEGLAAAASSSNGSSTVNEPAWN